METKKSKVKRIVHKTKQYNGKHGKVFVHQIEFDNGDKGEYHSKSETCTKFEEGSDFQYTIETKQNGNYTNVFIKPVLEDQKSFAKKNSGSDESFALSYAKDLACANITAGRVVTSKQTIEVAEEFYEWLKSKKQ